MFYFVPAAHWRAVSFKKLQNNNVFIIAHIISQSNLNVSANESFFQQLSSFSATPSSYQYCQPF